MSSIIYSTSSNLCESCEVIDLFGDEKLQEFCRTCSEDELNDFLGSDDTHHLLLECAYFVTKHNRLDLIQLCIELDETCHIDEFDYVPRVAYEEGHLEALKLVLSEPCRFAKELLDQARSDSKVVDVNPLILEYLESLNS